MDGERDNHIYRKASCPWGRKSIDLLDEEGVRYVDHVFADKAEEEAFKQEHGVATTPQTFLDGKRIGGYDELAGHFGMAGDGKGEETSYVPVIAVFAVALLLALATATGLMGFMGFSLAILACLKLMDLQAFVTGFEKYDFLTMKLRAYGRVYPFVELAVGLGFLSGMLPMLTGWVAILVGAATGASIVKAVYIDGTDLSCACVGGNSKVPLGAVSVTENAIMVVMGAALVAGLV